MGIYDLRERDLKDARDERDSRIGGAETERYGEIKIKKTITIKTLPLFLSPSVFTC